jgi:hypothetical protein
MSRRSAERATSVLHTGATLWAGEGLAGGGRGGMIRYPNLCQHMQQTGHALHASLKSCWPMPPLL